MNQIPEYKFTLFSDQLIVDNLGTVGTEWINQAANIPAGIVNGDFNGGNIAGWTLQPVVLPTWTWQNIGGQGAAAVPGVASSTSAMLYQPLTMKAGPAFVTFNAVLPNGGSVTATAQLWAFHSISTFATTGKLLVTLPTTVNTSIGFSGLVDIPVDYEFIGFRVVVSGAAPTVYGINDVTISGQQIGWTGGGLVPISSVGTGLSTVHLRRVINFDLGFDYDLLSYWTFETGSRIQFSAAATGQVLYTGFYKGSPRQNLVRFKFRPYAGMGNEIRIQVISTTNPLSSAPINVRFSAFFIRKLKGNVRVVVPGNFRSIAVTAERSVSFFGIAKYLTGSIELFGEDWKYIRNQLRNFPSQQVFCLVEINSGNGYFQAAEPVALDTLTLIAKGLSSTYRTNIAFLKSGEWNRFVSYLDTDSDLKQVGLDGYDTLDSRGWTEVIPPPFDGSNYTYPQVQMQFDGEPLVNLTPLNMNARQVLYIGFGVNQRRNDGIETTQGFNSNGSFSIPNGGFTSIVGTVILEYSKTGSIDVEVYQNGGWVGMSSNFQTAISVTTALGSKGRSVWWGIRVAETSNGSGSITIFSGRIQFTAEVVYPLSFVGQPINQTVKALLSNTAGNEAVWNAPLFNNQIVAGRAELFNGFGTSGFPYTNPPVKYRPFNAANPAAISNMDYASYGNIYQGNPIDWIRTGTSPNYSHVFNGVGVSNLLATTNLITGREYYLQTPNWIMRGTYATSINITAVTGTVSMKIYGIVGLDKYLVYDLGVVSVSAPPSFNINVTRDYEYMALEATNAASSSVTVFVFSMTVVQAGTVGQFGNNLLCRGNNLYGVDSVNTQLQTIIPRNRIVYSSTADILRGLCGAFGVGIIPSISTAGKLVLDAALIDNLLLDTINPININVQHYELEIDEDLVRAIVRVGGPIRNIDESDALSPCGQANYSSEYVTARAEREDFRELTFALVLNQPLIVQKDLTDTQTFLINTVMYGSGPGGGYGWRYRLAQELTISDTPSPFQLNWVHTEGRIMRRNLSLLSAMGSLTFSFISGNASAIARVNFPADGYGAIADEDLIIGNKKFTPWKARFETDMTFGEYQIFESGDNLYRTLNVTPDGGTTFVPCYLKAYSYNYALGKLSIEVWLKTYDTAML